MDDPSILERLFSMWFFWKAVGLCVIVGVASFWYRFSTGRDISELFTALPPSVEAEPSASAGDRLPPPTKGPQA